MMSMIVDGKHVLLSMSLRGGSDGANPRLWHSFKNRITNWEQVMP